MRSAEQNQYLCVSLFLDGTAIKWGCFLGGGLRTIFIIHSDLPRHKRVPELATEPTPTRNGLGFCFVFGAWTRADVLITFTIRVAKFKFRILKKC